jgi:hypothetical protein
LSAHSSKVAWPARATERFASFWWFWDTDDCSETRWSVLLDFWLGNDWIFESKHGIQMWSSTLSTIVNTSTLRNSSPLPGCGDSMTCSWSMSASEPCWVTTASRSRPRGAHGWPRIVAGRGRKQGPYGPFTIAWRGRRATPRSAEKIAEVIGIGALKYADLSQNLRVGLQVQLRQNVGAQGKTAKLLRSTATPVWWGFDGTRRRPPKTPKPRNAILKLN